MSRLYAGTKIVAIGRNYAAHAREMGGAGVRPEVPLFFLKPNSSVVHPGSPIVKPRAVKELHHEVELGVVIGARARYMKAGDWARHVSGYCLGLDMTSRDLQARAKATGGPWTQSKCYDSFTGLSEEIGAERVADPHKLELYLSVDGAERQRASTAHMLHTIPELIAYVSSVMTLERGDVILTGTPEGVGPVSAGQTIVAGITGLLEARFPVVDEALLA